ncbi:MAG: hypothetical protein CMM93_03935 [Rickettsiales bacterium]|nr:hypothetical protein [Rickettsiales bacterium]|tara:strand:- start:357 stop:863 length:507 start_codon:yes stop_codon:yes gene_type:complete
MNYTAEEKLWIEGHYEAARPYIVRLAFLGEQCKTEAMLDAAIADVYPELYRFIDTLALELQKPVEYGKPIEKTRSYDPSTRLPVDSSAQHRPYTALRSTQSRAHKMAWEVIRTATACYCEEGEEPLQMQYYIQKSLRSVQRLEEKVDKARDWTSQILSTFRGDIAASR